MLKFTLLLSCLSVALAAVPDTKLPLAGHINFMEFMMQTHDATQRDATGSMRCFDYYVPILNNHTAVYKENYAACVQTAVEARSEVDVKTRPDREDIEKSAQLSCSELAACANREDSVDYFSCFVEAGSVNSKAMYGISFNASEILMSVREKYRLIEDSQFRCTNATERAFVENTASTYEQLQACIEGKAPVPPTTKPATPEPEEPNTTEEPAPTDAKNANEMKSRGYFPGKDDDRHFFSGKFGRDFK